MDERAACIAEYDPLLAVEPGAPAGRKGGTPVYAGVAGERSGYCCQLAGAPPEVDGVLDTQKRGRLGVAGVGRLA